MKTLGVIKNYITKVSKSTYVYMLTFNVYYQSLNSTYQIALHLIDKGIENYD
jgi:hypothetical protein